MKNEQREFVRFSLVPVVRMRCTQSLGLKAVHSILKICFVLLIAIQNISFILFSLVENLYFLTDCAELRVGVSAAWCGRESAVAAVSGSANLMWVLGEKVRVQKRQCSAGNKNQRPTFC